MVKQRKQTQLKRQSAEVYPKRTTERRPDNDLATVLIGKIAKFIYYNIGRSRRRRMAELRKRGAVVGISALLLLAGGFFFWKGWNRVTARFGDQVVAHFDGRRGALAACKDGYLKSMPLTEDNSTQMGSLQALLSTPLEPDGLNPDRQSAFIITCMIKSGYRADPQACSSLSYNDAQARCFVSADGLP